MENLRQSFKTLNDSGTRPIQQVTRYGVKPLLLDGGQAGPPLPGPPLIIWNVRM